MSQFSGTWSEVIYSNRAPYTGVGASSTAEASLLTPVSPNIFTQAVLPALAFQYPGAGAYGKVFEIEGEGIITNATAGNFTLTTRFGTTAGASYLGGTILGINTAVALNASVTAAPFYFNQKITCWSPGIGGGACVLGSFGTLRSPTGFNAAPFETVLLPTTGPTYSATIDSSVTQYINLSATFSASNSGNLCTLYGFRVRGLN